MREKIFIRTLCYLFVAAMACGPVIAQHPTVAGSGKQISLPSSSVVTPYRDADAPDVNITVAQNLGPTGNVYSVTNGWIVSGPSSVTFGPTPFSVGVQFRPSVNCHAKILEAAIGWVEGVKRVRLGIYTSSGGAVGTLIQDGATANIPNFGACCVLTKVTLSGLGAALTAGTDYFLVATSDPAAPDFAAGWAFVPPFGGGDNGQSFNDGTGWGADWTLYVAYRVRGTNP